MPRHAMSGKTRAAVVTFDRYIADISEGLLSAEEEAGLRACLPRLAQLAEDMRIIAKPVNEWSPEEMMRFLTLAVRAAVPLRQMHGLSPDLNDEIPI